MFTKFISKNIQEKMKAKERALARKVSSNNPNEHLSIKDMATRTPFVRMASNKSNVRHNKLIEGGLRDGNFENKQFGFSKAYDDGKFGGEIKPLPGIKSIECSYKGGFKAIRECTVSWVVPHIDMLNELTPHFFTVGKTVVVDWGWVYGNKKIDSQLVDTFIYFGNDVVTSRVNGQNVDNDIRNVLIDPNIFNNPQDLILKKDGDYDAIGGQITNFEYNLREDGGFDCVTKIIAMGNSLFKKPIDRGGNQAGLKISGKDAKSTPPDSLINCILNLENIVKFNVFKAKSSVNGEVANIYQVEQDIRNGYENLAPVQDAKGKKVSGYGIFADTIPKKTFGPTIPTKEINSANNKGRPDVIYTIRDHQRDIFVTWGWFEDNIVNRYISFEAGDTKDIKLTMRSIDSVLDNEGKPIPTKDLSEDIITEYEKKYDIDLENLSEYNEFVKRDSLIRNPPGMVPVNPFKFFIAEKSSTDFIDGSQQDLSIPLLSYMGVTILKYKSPKGLTSMEQFYSKFTTLGTNLKRFQSNTKIGFGKLRNIYVNIKEIQNAFGIRDANSKDTSSNNINPPGTIETAINNLLTNLNTNFHNVWDFELCVDPYNSTNIKVIDKSDTEEKNPQYTTYQENSNLVKDDGGGIFQFPAFKVGSFVKNQSLTFKIPDAQAITILYGSNKQKGDNDPEFANGQLDKLFRNDKTSEFDDAYLKNMKSSHQNSAGQNGVIKTNVGSEDVNPNTPISTADGFGLNINPKASKSWWKQWTPDVETSSNKTSGGNSKTEPEGYFEVIQTPNGPKIEFIGIKSRDKNPVMYSVNEKKELVLNPKIQYTLNSYLNSNSPVQQFDMSNLIPAELGLEIDGTGGIIPFDLIHTEYIEEKYKSELISYAYLSSDESREAGINEGPEQDGESELSDANIDIITSQPPKEELGPLTYFQLFDVTHKVDETGWKTELNSKMRINHIPRDDFVTFVKEEEAPPPERPFISVPMEDEDIVGDQELEDLDFEDIPEFQEIPAPVSRTNLPVNTSTDVDIEGDVDLEDLDFDDIPPWIPPPYPSTLALRRAKTEIENQPERVPDVSPPGPPLLDVGPVLGPDEIDKLIANAITNGTAVNNNTDLVEYPPEPDPRVEPVLPSQPIRRGGDYGNLNPLSLLDQIKSQKIIYVQPAPELTNETGEVQKPQRFEAPQVEELNFESPVEATIAVNENIKKELPKEIVVATPQELNFIEKKSTYNFSLDHNRILYNLREDWRPLYKKTNGSLTGARFSGKGEDRVENTLVRSGQPKEIRQAYWDAYIEGKNESGKSQTKFVDKDNFTIFPPVQPTGDLLRRERDTYWYGEWNPGYTPPS